VDSLDPDAAVAVIDSLLEQTNAALVSWGAVSPVLTAALDHSLQEIDRLEAELSGTHRAA